MQSAKMAKGLIQVPQIWWRTQAGRRNCGQLSQPAWSRVAVNKPGSWAKTSSAHCASAVPHTDNSPAPLSSSGLERHHYTGLGPLERAPLEKVRSEEQEALPPALAHQVLTCLAPSPPARSHAAPMNAVFLLPAAKPLAAPHPLLVGREKSQDLFFCPFPLPGSAQC